MVSKFKSVLQDYKLLLNNVPALMTSFFIITTLLMNLGASKIIFSLGNVNLTGGFLLSFAPFLAMDTITRRFNARASIMLNVLSALGNLLAVIFLAIVAAIPTETPYPEFNYVFGSVWFIVFGSTVAFVLSGVVNSILNSAIGKLFEKKDPDGAFAFYSRSWISTFVGQAVDNFLFLYIVYGIFAPIYWNMSLSILDCLVTGVLGGLVELALEAIISPIGLKIVRKWDEEDVGRAYIDAHKDDKF